MRKLSVIAAALGFLAATSLPTLAASPATGLTNSYELSAATHKKNNHKKKTTSKKKTGKKTTHAKHKKATHKTKKM